MTQRLDKSLLRRLNQLEPPIDQDILADTLCDGELLAVVLDRWALAHFEQIHGIIVNRTVVTDPAFINRIPSIIARQGTKEAEKQINKCYDFEVLNDPCCPKPVLKYILESLAYLWEAQAKRDFPERKLRFRVGWDENGGIDGDFFIEMLNENEDGGNTQGNSSTIRNTA